MVTVPWQVKTKVLRRIRRMQGFAEHPLRREEAARMAEFQAQSDARA